MGNYQTTGPLACPRKKIPTQACFLLWLLAVPGGCLPGLCAWAEEIRLRFNPGLEHAVCESIGHCRESLAIEMYDLSDKSVLAGLSLAARRGVAIRVILCPTQDTNIKTAEILRRSGMDVRWFPLEKPGQKMHLKMGIFDGRLLLLGSPNWTHSGLNLNHEGLLAIAHTREVRQALAQFEIDWASATSVCPVRLPGEEFGRH